MRTVPCSGEHREIAIRKGSSDGKVPLLQDALEMGSVQQGSFSMPPRKRSVLRSLTRRPQYDAIVVGAGPNGMAASLTLAEAGRSVLLVESSTTVGGGLRSSHVRGCVTDRCATILALAPVSPFFRAQRLELNELEWIRPEVPLAQLLDNGNAVWLHRSVEETARNLGADGCAYARIFNPLVNHSDAFFRDVLRPVGFPSDPIRFAGFALRAVSSAAGFIRKDFRTSEGQSLMAGLAAHAGVSLDLSFTAAVPIVLGVAAHSHGWPVARGGSQSVVTAIERRMAALGVECVTNCEVRSVEDLPPSRAVLLDLSADRVAQVGRAWLTRRYRRRLHCMNHGSAVFKMDWILNSHVPWRDDNLLRAGTIHLGGECTSVLDSLREVGRGVIPTRPFIILVQASVFDSTRVSREGHVLWAYCQVPRFARANMIEAIESEIARYAPNFRACVVERRITTPGSLHRYNANYRGGDISGGAMAGFQSWARPMPAIVPYATSHPKLFLCSSSTPPGGGVHGMCGYYGARAALRSALR